ncbi:SUR7 [[Candida] subhashii]|uniref:SUR7 n=1 Tax=[Candida] subhashii TaxID=561895 RepID=A0A8J5QFU8_9ASCO|nr:SUR7 [[Candida] subhashii]KAG7660825.1 SUR7 [[Candida] subhashii]
MRVIHTFFNLFFLAGAILLLILTVLSGSINSGTFRTFYWLRADTADIPNAPADTSVWTFWGVCDQHNFNNCLLGPAYPISPVDNFNTDTNIPAKFIDNRDTFYFLSRFSFAFCLLALGFAGLAFIIDLLGFCFEAIDKVVVFLITIALFFQAGFAALQTSVVVLARSAFKDGNRSAKVGPSLMGFVWATFACLFICWVLTFSSNIARSYRKHMDRVKAERGEEVGGAGVAGDESSFTRAAAPAEHKDEEHTGGIRFFKIKRNQKVSDEDSE